ncbi:RNA-directed DNA polymerase, eukaryota, partial [Tanacetum coccineum]
RPRGFAFVRFVAPANAAKAKYHTDGCKAKELEAEFMELLKSYEECANLSSAIASVGNMYQQTEQPTNFKKLIDNEMAKTKRRSLASSQVNQLLRQFREAIWAKELEARFMELLKSYEECANLSSAIASVRNMYQQTKQVLMALMEAQSELSLATKSLVICAHKWRKSTTEQTLTTEILTIIVDAILEKPANSEGASTSKEDTPDALKGKFSDNQYVSSEACESCAIIYIYVYRAYTKVSSIEAWVNSKRAVIDTNLKQIERCKFRLMTITLNHFGRVVAAAIAVSVKGALPTLSSFGRDHCGNTSGSWIVGAFALPVAGLPIYIETAHAAEMERTFIAIKPDGTPPYDVIDIMARTIVTTMGAHKNETTNLENEPPSSELAARDTKATAKRPLLPQPSPEISLPPKDLEKVATSFYVTNFPDSIDSRGLWNIYAPYGRLIDAFIATKRSKGCKRFGFIRFIGVNDASSFVRSLSNIWIRSFHLYVSVARFQRPNKIRSNLDPKPRAPINETMENRNSDPKTTPCNNTDIPAGNPSFASIVHGSSKSSTHLPQIAKPRSVSLVDQDLINIEDATKVLLVKIKEIELMSHMY